MVHVVFHDIRFYIFFLDALSDAIRIVLRLLENSSNRLHLQGDGKEHEHHADGGRGGRRGRGLTTGAGGGGGGVSALTAATIVASAATLVPTAPACVLTCAFAAALDT